MGKSIGYFERVKCEWEIVWCTSGSFSKQGIPDTTAYRYPTKPEMELKTLQLPLPKQSLYPVNSRSALWKGKIHYTLTWEGNKRCFKQIPNRVLITERCFSFLEISYQIQTLCLSQKGLSIQTKSKRVYTCSEHKREHMKPFQIPLTQFTSCSSRNPLAGTIILCHKRQTEKQTLNSLAP